MKTTAQCPYCDETLTRVESYQRFDAVPGQQANISVRWKVQHEGVLCFEWQQERVTPEDLFAAFSDDAEE